MSYEANSYEAGVNAFKQGRYEEAIQVLQSFSQTCQQTGKTNSKLYAQAQMGLVKCYQATRQTQAAIALCRKFANSNHPMLQPWARQTLASITAQSSATATAPPMSSMPPPSSAPESESMTQPDLSPITSNITSATASSSAASEPTAEDPQLLEDGMKASRKGNHEEAISLLTEYMRCQPSEGSRAFMQVQMAIIKGYLALDHKEEAIARCKELQDTSNFALKSWISKTLGSMLPPEELHPTLLFRALLQSQRWPQHPHL